MNNSIDKFNILLKKSIIDELNRKISFGCVNKLSNGSHADMTYDTFIISCLSITDSLKQINWEEISNFNQLRLNGIKVEKNMFSKTRGINTHKGLVFLIMFLAYFYCKYGYIEGLENEISKFSTPLWNDYLIEKRAKIWNHMQITDIRHIPLTGFKNLISISKMKLDNDFDDCLLTIKLISIIDDTTTLRRSNLTTLKYVQNEAKEILKLNRNNKTEIINRAYKLSNFYLSNNLSSGGVADIFTVIKLLNYIKSSNRK